jgi:probable F420-dependent oxidoreductase
MRPFTFHAAVQDVIDGPALADLARHAESIGYASLVVPDHLIPQLSPVPAMATIAAATTTLRVGSFVFNNDLRHPAVLAQDLASIDVLSGGRLDIAIGAGWRKVEYDAIGVPFEPGSTRVARLAEAVAVLKGCFADAPMTFRGEHYRLDGYDGQPKPIQRPHPPLMIGGGRRKVLELAAREANVVGLAPRQVEGRYVEASSLTLAATEEKIDWVRAAAGDRFASLTLNAYPSVWPVTVTQTPAAAAQEVIDHLRSGSGEELSVAEVLTSPHLFVDSIDGFVERFRMIRERLGITSFMVGDVDTLAPVVERLAGS